jgi:hypothetical protein
MTVKLQSLKADLVRESEGDWVDIPDLPGVRLKVRSFHYGPYRMARDLLNQRLVKKYGRAPAPSDEVAREYGRLYADHLLLDWDGFDQPFTPETGRTVLTDPAYRSMLGHIEYAASKIGVVEADFIEDAAKN